MLQFNNNHIFSGYLKQFLSSFNLPTCKIYTAEFEKYYLEHGKEDPRVIESSLPITISAPTKIRPATGITYLKDGQAQQYFWNWNAANWAEGANQPIVKYWKSNKIIHYNGNRVLGLTKTLKNPTTLYNYQTHEYLGDYLRFLRDYENINLMSMYNCFSDRFCNNIKFKLDLEDSNKKVIKTVSVSSYDTIYKIYMLPVKLFENYTIAIDCFQGVELFCGLYNEKLDTSSTKAVNLIKKTYMKVPKTLFNQPFIYDKLNVKHWMWEDEYAGTIVDMDKFVRAEIAMRESELKLFIKMPAANTSSIVVLEGDYRNFNDSLYTISSGVTGDQYICKYVNNTTIINFETEKTYEESKLPDINSREFRPISKLQLLALNTGISYPFADRLVEYLVANVILPNDITPDNIKRLQKVMEDYGYNFQIDGVWEPKMQMILYDYLMNGGKFVVATGKDKDGNIVYKTKKDRAGNTVYDKKGNPVYLVENQGHNSEKWANKTITVTGENGEATTAAIHDPKEWVAGNLKQIGQKNRSDFYDVLGYVDKDAEKLYASWKVEVNEKTKKPQTTTKTTLENVDIYSNLYNN